MAKESFFKPFYTVLVLAFVCSFLVSVASVGLSPLQEANRNLERKKNILLAAGMYNKEADVEQLFSSIDARVINLSTGEFVGDDEVAAESFDQLASLNDNALSHALAKGDDPAGLRRLEKYALIYLIADDHALKQVILPIRGKGLWSTMYGYVSLDADLKTIRGISFFEHGETPGLGGEIENPGWLAGWQGKRIYDAQGEVALKVVKGVSKAQGEAALHEVDGLSGATLTGNGVERLFHFWFDRQGYKPFLDKLRHEEGQNG